MIGLTVDSFGPQIKALNAIKLAYLYSLFSLLIVFVMKGIKLFNTSFPTTSTTDKRHLYDEFFVSKSSSSSSSV